MKYLIILALWLYTFSDANAQANGSFFTLPLGQNKVLFKYSERSEKIKTKAGKDSTIAKKYLTLQDTTHRTVAIKYPWDSDTVQAVDPKTKKAETRIITYSSGDYHLSVEMSYSDFLILLKSKFELRNPQKGFRVYSYNIYYETATEGGMIHVKYPQTAEGVISKLNALVKGGFILLSLKAADHDLIPIDAGGEFLALIKIKN
jgi:hypothetical protein